MSSPAANRVALARFKTVNASEAIDVEVHFNPSSLNYTLSNALQPGDGGDRKKQFVSQTSATLTMDLVFDSTDSGDDVREATDQMARLLRPHGPSGKQVPPLVEFSWGAYAFNGLVSQYKEGIEYFSADGVPLRSTINLTLTSQDVSFDSGRNPAASVDIGVGIGIGGGDLVTLPSAQASFGGAAGLSMSLGDPRAARAIASVNGSASLRFSGGVEMAVGAGAGVSLSAAAAFSAGASAGFGIGVSGGVGVSAGASAGASFGGLRAGAGVSAGLPSAGAALALTAGAQPSLSAVGVGGKARAGGRASLGTDVGARATIRFGD